MKQQYIEQRTVYLVSCYREEKFAIGNNDVPTEMKIVLEEKQKCHFGLKEINSHVCPECKWIKLSKISDGINRHLAADRIITETEIEKLRIEYKNINNLPSQKIVKVYVTELENKDTVQTENIEQSLSESSIKTENAELKL